jgi:polyphosphate glucokinase
VQSDPERALPVESEEDLEHYRIAALDSGPRTLSIDVGGSAVKASVLNTLGARLAHAVKAPTPRPAPPERLLEVIEALVGGLPAFDRISVGFPGAVRQGVTLTAPNLDDDAWRGFDLASTLRRRLGRPARVLNDAEVQGLAVIEARGLEMVVTLGTGFGFGLFQDGRPGPHLEMAHHPFRKGQTYEEQLGDRALKRIGKKKWNRRLEKAIATLRHLANFDRLYLGGGNARHVQLELPPDVVVVSNEAGIQGGIALWRDEDNARRSWLEGGGTPDVL